MQGKWKGKAAKETGIFIIVQLDYFIADLTAFRT